jgi:hypothetical protein
VTGGPRGTRRCRFYESVDAYQRTCTARVNPDGSLTVTAPGTRLNPDHGFSFTAGGGPNRFSVSGTLNAFSICRGPFTGEMISILDQGKTVYELRFREHCKIEID